jgi:hypothetical protein
VAYKICVSPIFQISQICINELTVIQLSISHNTVIHFCSCKLAFKNLLLKLLIIIINNFWNLCYSLSFLLYLQHIILNNYYIFNLKYFYNRY